MQVPIDSIVVNERVRREMGDLGPLMDSMAKYGQLSPVILTRTHELIAGHRRLVAAQRLGWHAVAAVYVDHTDEAEKLEMELQENVHRKDFSPEELLEGYQRLEKLRQPPLRTRVGRFFKGLFKRWFRRRKPDPPPQPKPAYPASSPPAAQDWQASDYGV